MLQLAKTESKKEMFLKRKKKYNNPVYNPISNKRNFTQLNIFELNNNTSNYRFHHDNIKKSDLLNKRNNSLQKKYIQNEIISLRKNINSNSYKYLPKTISPIKRKKNIKIFSLQNNKTPKKKIIRNRNDNKSKELNKQKQKTEIENEKNKMLKTAENGRIRKIIAMSSDIFNLNNTATNLFNKSNLSPEIIYKKEKKNNKPYDIISNKIISMEKPKDKFNRVNIINRSQYNKNETYSLNSKGKKTNSSNIESVKYDIISTRKSNIFDKYNNLSGVKASTSKYEDYEIIVPKDYNKSNINNYKTVFNSNGMHIFGIKEEGDIIAGQKGKYKIKVRTNGKEEKEKKKMIDKSNNKLMNMDVKFKKNIDDWRKKKTDITS